MSLARVIENLKFAIMAKVLLWKVDNKNKIKYYIKNSELFFNRGFNNLDKIDIEYDSIIDLITMCEKIERAMAKKNMDTLPKLPNNAKTQTMGLFYTYENRYIENKLEITIVLLERVLSIYELDISLKRDSYLFFSKSIQPYIIILEKYLNKIFII